MSRFLLRAEARRVFLCHTSILEVIGHGHTSIQGAVGLYILLLAEASEPILLCAEACRVFLCSTRVILLLHVIYYLRVLSPVESPRFSMHDELFHFTLSTCVKFSQV